MRMWAAIDLTLRFVYVALVPFLLPFINLLMPITGLLIGTGIATAVALIGSDVWLARVERIPFAGKLLAGLARLGAFYREHPPKPLVYYIFYPILLPVIVLFRVPRREFLLYRKLNAVTIVVVVATGAWDYVRHWRPELTFAQFAGATFVMFVFQMVVTFMFVMPIVTTLIAFRLRARTTTLSVLVVCMVATGAWGAYDAHRSHAMSIMTWTRLEERTKYARVRMIMCEMAHPDGIERCIVRDPELRAMADALKAAHGAKSVDDALDLAHDKLASFYKPDEAAAFRIVELRGQLVLFAQRGHKPAIWLGYYKNRFLIHPDQLTPELQRKLKL
jgi:hypothetical protein